jgi:polyisoprenyl-teichoic acid--peptidoglycan teichoic acid transferase
LYKTQENGKLANNINNCNPELIKKTTGEILDLPIHYYVSINFSGFRKAIDSVGGVEIDVERTFTDYQYPANDGVNYLSPQTFRAGLQHMDGKRALIYTRSRYGNNSEGTDFARSKRQQKVIQAFKIRLFDRGILSNPAKLISLVNIIGSNVRTDFKVEEIKALSSLIKDIDTDNMISKVLENGTNGAVETFNLNGTSYVKPRAGINEWIDIRKIAHEIFTDPFLRKEKASIEIINSSGINGAAADLSVILKSYGYNIARVSSGEESLKKTVIYDYSGGEKKYTLEFLSKRLSADIIKKSKPAESQTDIQIILGENHKTVYAKSKY